VEKSGETLNEKKRGIFLAAKKRIKQTRALTRERERGRCREALVSLLLLLLLLSS
jgi:hypothetical protein